jgi:hypothetical protein
MWASLARLQNVIRRDLEAIVGQQAQPRFAVVAGTDETTHSVRVLVQPEGVLSGWIPDASAVMATGGFGIVAPLRVGDQVKVLHIRAGRIDYCSDSRHALAGCSVELPNIPADWLE